MIKIIDPFGKEVILEVVPSIFNNRVGFVTRRERQSIYESWDIETAKKIIEALQSTINILEEHNGK